MKLELSKTVLMPYTVSFIAKIQWQTNCRRERNHYIWRYGFRRLHLHFVNIAISVKLRFLKLGNFLCETTGACFCTNLFHTW